MICFMYIHCTPRERYSCNGVICVRIVKLEHCNLVTVIPIFIIVTKAATAVGICPLKEICVKLQHYNLVNVIPIFIIAIKAATAVGTPISYLSVKV